MNFVILCALAAVTVAVASANDAHFLSEDYINEINSRQSQWKAGVNFDPSTPLSELKQLLGTIMTGRDNDKRILKTSDPLWPEDKKLPKNFDSRKRWRKKCPKIGEVLDQGRCGSCWAIATAQAFTDRYCIATKGRHKARLSTSSIISCCQNCGNGCQGGWEHLAWDYLVQHGTPSGGLYNTSQGCYPYNIESPCNYNDGSPYPKCAPVRGTPNCETRCTNRKYKKSMGKDNRFAKNRHGFPADEKVLMKEIYAHGPITAAFQVKDDFFNYKSGVYEPAPNTKSVGGHAVKLLGWGVEKNVPYWLVMNSWNKYWGDHGLVKMKRNSPNIKLESECYAADIDRKKKFEIEEFEEESEDFDVSADHEEDEEEAEEEEEENSGEELDESIDS